MLNLFQEIDETLEDFMTCDHGNHHRWSFTLHIHPQVAYHIGTVDLCLEWPSSCPLRGELLLLLQDSAQPPERVCFAFGKTPLFLFLQAISRGGTTVLLLSARVVQMKATACLSPRPGVPISQHFRSPPWVCGSSVNV